MDSPHPDGKEKTRSIDHDHTPAENYFAKGGECYAQFRPTYPVALAEALASECAQTGHALDVGCGSGQLSVLLATCFDRVTATDPSEAQLASAQTDPSVSYRQEPAERIGLPDSSVDLVVAAQAAHWFDLPIFYAEATRVLRSCGVLALVSYGVPMLNGAVGQRLADFYWRDIHDFWPKGRRHVETGYRTLAFPFPEQPLPHLAIEHDWLLDDLLGYVETWSAARLAREAGAVHLIEKFTNDLYVLWGQRGHKRTIHWPITGRITRV